MAMVMWMSDEGHGVRDDGATSLPPTDDQPTLDEASSEMSDAALIQRLCNQDLSALGGLFDRYYAQIYRTAYAITRDSAVAEDVAQDCFLKLHQYAQRIDTTLPLAPWLYRVSVNLSYTWISRRQKRRVSLEALVDQLMSPAWSAPDHLAEQGEIQRRVQHAVSELPLNQRAVVVLHYLSGMSLEEIADIIGCPVGTVKSRLYYARETLRRRLGELRQTFEVAHGYAGIG
ncbi:MAG: RNA polymerase sigma factor [Chloroflexota bacterium]|nr:RNA polymerase sigma factor [Chloroflexota bacterium]